MIAKNGTAKKPPLIQIAMPLEENGFVLGHMMHWLMGLARVIGDFRLDDGHGNDVPHVRNHLARRFLGGDADVLWFVDSDMDPRLGSKRAEAHGGAPYIVEALMRDDVDVVSGISFRLGTKGPVPCLNSTGGKKRILETIWSQEKGLIDGADLETGGACLAIKRRVLEGFLDAKKVWFKNELEEEDPRRFGALNLSEDYHFIRTAKELGFRFWVDTRVCWGHIKPRDLRDELLMAEELIEQAEKAPPKRLVEVAR